jgi:formate dehydrogenase major subunit/formate dehydrogenase-N alpha subunit
MAGTTVASLGFLSSFSVHAETRQYKLLKAKETRNNCTYCSVGCGMLMYSLGDTAKNVKESIYHIEGDPDHPVSRGSLCPKGAGVLDYIHSETRLKYPEYRAPGSDKWVRISWDDAINRIARLMKDDRDANFIEKMRRGRPSTAGPPPACSAPRRPVMRPAFSTVNLPAAWGWSLSIARRVCATGRPSLRWHPPLVAVR